MEYRRNREYVEKRFKDRNWKYDSVEREKDIQRQTVDRIRNTRYNKRYKGLGMEIERNIVIILEEKYWENGW